MAPGLVGQTIERAGGYMQDATRAPTPSLPRWSVDNPAEVSLDDPTLSSQPEGGVP
jgi:hypothetical protein